MHGHGEPENMQTDKNTETWEVWHSHLTEIDTVSCSSFSLIKTDFILIFERFLVDVH